MAHPVSRQRAKRRQQVVPGGCACRLTGSQPSQDANPRPPGPCKISIAARVRPEQGSKGGAGLGVCAVSTALSLTGRLVEKVDAEIGRILDALRANGLEEDTLVVFTSDHGDGHGSHHWNQKSILYEEEVKVPMIVSLPGVTRAGALDEHLVSMGLDLLPTVCDYAGIALPEGLTGLSLRELAEGREPATWRDAVYAETMISVGKKLAARMVRTNQFKYAVYEWGQYREQLMDLERDPGEMVNLAVESRYADVLQEHRRLLWEWCHATGDTFGKHYSHPGQVSVPGYEWKG